MAENVFGIEAAPGAPDDKYKWLSDETETTEPDVDAEAEGTPAEAAPEAAPAPATDEAQEASTPDEVRPTAEDLAALQAAETEAVPQEGETVEEAVERLYANKYKTPEDLEKGYRERSDMWRRAVERAKAEEAQRLTLEQQMAQYEAAFKQVIPTLEQAAAREKQIRDWAEMYRQETGQFPPGYQAPPAQQGPPSVGPEDVQRMVEERLVQERAAMAAQYAQQTETQALQEAVLGFYQDHPEVEPHGALDTEITDAMAALNESDSWMSHVNPDGSYGIIVDPSDRETLDVLYEVSRRPALLEVLKLRPEYFTSETGLEIARRDAALIEGVPTTTEPTQAAVPASRAGARAGTKLPFAESAQGAVPENTAPDMNDPWERVKAAADGPSRSASDRKSVFFE